MNREYKYSELKESTLLMQKRTPSFGWIITLLTLLLMIAIIILAALTSKTYIVKANAMAVSEIKSNIMNKVNAPIKTICVTEGQSVVKGDVLFEFDSTDCGAACIATICLQYKKEMTISKLRDLSGTDIKGATAFGLVSALNSLGFEAKVGKVPKEAFEENITTPFIANVLTPEGLLHFVVIHKILKDKLIIADPAKGLLKLSKDTFFENFYGNIIVMVPTNQFVADKTKTANVFSRFVKLLLAQKQLFIWAIIGSIVLTILGIASSFFNKILMDEILPYNLKSQLTIFCIGFGLVAFFNILLDAARQHLLLHLSIKIDLPLMTGYFKHIYNLPMKFFGTRRTGDILTRFQDAGTIKDVFTSIILSLIIDILLTIVSGIILGIMNIKLFLVILVLTLINVILVYVFKRPYKKINIEQMEKQATLNSTIIDGLKGIETVKSFGIEQDTMDKMENKYVSAIKTGYKEGVLSNVQGSISGIVGTIGNIVLMFIGATMVMNGNITLGSLFAFSSLSGFFMEPIGRLVSLQLSIQEANIAMKRMGELYEIDEEQENKENLIHEVNLKDNIEIKNLTFRYGSRKPVLENINYIIPYCKKIAIVGESGGGKTTLVKLLLGLWNYEQGEIKIGNADIQSIEKTILRQKIAYVPQNVELFSGSILENIKLGTPNATLNEVEIVCKRTGCINFINQLPARYNTFLEEAGANLSGGEKQRISLARAILKKPEILILDEATSNLDFISESEIYQTIFNLKCTVIIIAHRLSTIRSCDDIIVLDNSKIFEHGTHDELLLKDGVYSKIWKSQMEVIRQKEVELSCSNTISTDENDITYI